MLEFVIRDFTQIQEQGIHEHGLNNIHMVSYYVEVQHDFEIIWNL